MNSKLLRSELKEIVKECLVEILSEGISTNPEKRAISENSLTSGRRSTFDHVSWAKENKIEEPPAPSSRIVAESLTSDPILAEVLADSQKTMLDQMAAEGRGPQASAGDAAQRRVSESDPVALFGESASNWASLAFDSK